MKAVEIPQPRTMFCNFINMALLCTTDTMFCYKKEGTPKRYLPVPLSTNNGETYLVSIWSKQ